jgi:uncharacterized protein YbaA (DUF1428 family)
VTTTGIAAGAAAATMRACGRRVQQHGVKEHLMEQYIDGYLLSVPKANIEAYRKLAEQAGSIWLEYGALEFRACVADDIDGEGFGSFSAAASAREGETVVFSWIAFASKAERDRINAKVMADPRLTGMSCEGVFDFKRMCWGGFSTLVSKSARA